MADGREAERSLLAPAPAPASLAVGRCEEEAAAEKEEEEEAAAAEKALTAVAAADSLTPLGGGVAGGGVAGGRVGEAGTELCCWSASMAREAWPEPPVSEGG